MAQAASLLREGCTLGDARGCVELGQLFRNGKSVASDFTRASSLFKEACDKGSADGCGRLAVMLESGDNIGRDLIQARDLYKKACDAGVPLDCYHYARQFQRPETRDVAVAAKYNRQACDGGVPSACYEVGLLFETGTTVPRDPIKALGFFEQACKGKYDQGCEKAKRMKR
jgi:TPR repeat protein